MNILDLITEELTDTQKNYNKVVGQQKEKERVNKLARRYKTLSALNKKYDTYEIEYEEYEDALNGMRNLGIITPKEFKTAFDKAAKKEDENFKDFDKNFKR